MSALREIDERTGDVYAAPLAPPSGAITETGRIGEAHVVVAEVVSWFRRPSITIPLGVFLWTAWTAIEPVLVQIQHGDHVVTNWWVVGRRALIAGLLGAAAWIGKTRNVVSR